MKNNIMKGKNLGEQAREHKELKQALDFWKR